MSCSICRLPFVPGPGSTDPYPLPPKGILTADQYMYLAYGVGIGSNMFGCYAPVLQTIIWDSPGGTFIMAHTTCGALLRHILDAEPNTIANLTKLASLEIVLGRPQSGIHAGRFKYIDYEYEGCDRVDLRPFWLPGILGEGDNVFDWNGLLRQGLDWTLSRPDVFPKFFAIVSEERLSSVRAVDTTPTNILTSQPLDILHSLIGFLSIESYVILMSTCRYLRNLALTVFQPHACTLVLTLPWALPLQAEYLRHKSHALDVAHAETSPRGGDWMRYLGHVHCTKNMRVRRWVWKLCAELERVYEERKQDALVEGGADKSWGELEKEVKKMWDITWGMQDVVDA